MSGFTLPEGVITCARLTWTDVRTAQRDHALEFTDTDYALAEITTLLTKGLPFTVTFVQRRIT